MSLWSKHILPFLYGLDEAINGLLGGEPNETLSGTVGRAALAGKWWAINLAQPFINWLMRNPNHCKEAAEKEEARREAIGDNKPLAE